MLHCRRYRPSFSARILSSFLLLAFILQMMPLAAFASHPSPSRIQPKQHAETPVRDEVGLKQALQLAGIDPSKYSPMPNLPRFATRAGSSSQSKPTEQVSGSASIDSVAPRANLFAAEVDLPDPTR